MRSPRLLLLLTTMTAALLLLLGASSSTARLLARKKHVIAAAAVGQHQAFFFHHHLIRDNTARKPPRPSTTTMTSLFSSSPAPHYQPPPGPLGRSAVRISRRLFDLLNAQGNREWEASLFYAGLSHWFNKNELHGSEQWCAKHSEEEKGHAYKIFHHLSDRELYDEGGEEEPQAEGEEESSGQQFRFHRSADVCLEVKGRFHATFDHPVDIWKAAVDQEMNNSGYFWEILTVAREMRDYTTENLIMSFFIPEQFEEEKAVMEIYENTKLVTKKGPELYFELDRQMGTKPH